MYQETFMEYIQRRLKEKAVGLIILLLAWTVFYRLWTGQILLAGISIYRQQKIIISCNYSLKRHIIIIYLAMKYNLATVINKLGIYKKNNSIHKVRQPFPTARTGLLLLTYVPINKRSKLKIGLGLVSYKFNTSI